jgi:hypothetical protein
MWVDAPGLAMVLLGVSVFDWCCLWWFLAFLLHGIYRSRQESDTKINAINEMQRVVCYMIMNNLTTLTPMRHLLNYPLPF